MLSPSSESQSMEATVALGGAAPGACAMTDAPALLGTASRFQILDDSGLDEEERATDWMDSASMAAGDRTHLLFGSPAPAPNASVLPTQPPCAAGFPLLDDDGNVIEGLQMLPYRVPAAFEESTAEFGFPLGPLIWEPEPEGDCQICMDPEDEGEVGPERGIARLSASDIALPAPSPFEREIVVPFRGVMLPPVSAAPAATQSASESPPWGEYHSTTPTQTHPHEGPKETMASILQSLRNEAALSGETPRHGHDQDGALTTVPSLASERGASGEPLSFADWMLSSQQQVPAHTPRSHASRFMVDDQPEPSSTHSNNVKAKAHERPHEAWQSVTDEQPPLSTPYHGPALVYHRSVAPMAPVGQATAPASSRPLAVILAVLILTVALLAVAIWGDGYRPRSKESPPPPWTQEAVPTQESAAASVP